LQKKNHVKSENSSVIRLGYSLSRLCPACDSNEKTEVANENLSHDSNVESVKTLSDTLTLPKWRFEIRRLVEEAEAELKNERANALVSRSCPKTTQRGGECP
jgi:hypothetical protein